MTSCAQISHTKYGAEYGHVLGLRELCRNNFGNFDSYSGIIPELFQNNLGIIENNAGIIKSPAHLSNNI